MQIGNYKSSLQNQYQTLLHQDQIDIGEAFEPTCAVIVGNYSKEFGASKVKQKSFGLFRSHLKDILIITYDELFGKVRLLIDFMEGFAGKWGSKRGF